jgi:hypothetical protein
MLDIVLRVYGERFDVDSFLAQYSDLVVADAFRKGEKDMLGNANEFSGFDVIAVENETKENCLQKVQQFLEVHKLPLTFLKANAVQCVLDIDATVKATDEMPTSLSLSPQLLGDLHHLNIAIEFSAYPEMTGF